MSTVTTQEDRHAWDCLAAESRVAQVHQCLWWAEPLERHGVRSRVVAVWDNRELAGGALFRSVRVPLTRVTIMESLDGPIFRRWDESWADAFIEGTIELARAWNSMVVSLRACPNAYVHRQIEECARRHGLRTSLVPGDTRAVVDLNGSTPDEVWARFSRTVRRSIKRAQTNGVRVRRVTDPLHLQEAHRAWMATAARKGFTEVRPWPAVEPVIRTSIEKDVGCVLASFKDDQMLGALFVTYLGETAEGFYAGFFDGTEDLRPNHVLHHEAIRIAIERGMKGYSFGRMVRPSEPGTHGVDQFKLSFGPTLRQGAPTIVWERKPLHYRSFQWLRRRQIGAYAEALAIRWLRRER